MNIDIVTQYVLAIAPSVTAIISVATAMIISIKKIKNETMKSNAAVAKENRDIKEALAAVIKENAELKKAQKALMNKIVGIEE